MINALQLVRNVGQFDSVSSAAALRLTPVTLVYAENARGKTTLAAVLRSLATGDPIPVAERRRLAAPHSPHVVVDCTGGPPHAVFQNGAWNRTLSNITVFDDLFVDENVCSGLIVEAEHRQRLHEWILGALGVTLNRALQTCVERVEELNRSLRAKADAIPATVRAGLSADDFCALRPRDDIDAAIQEAERALSAAEQQETITNARVFEPLALPELNTDEIARVLTTDLPELDAAAAAQVQAHLGPMGEEGEAWVASGMQWVGTSGEERCPFCAQDLRGSMLIHHYRAYFSAQYAQLKQHIADVTDEFLRTHGPGDMAAVFERNIRLAMERRQYWSQFTEMPAIEVDTAAIAEAWAPARDIVFTALQRKQNAPLERIVFSAADMDRIRAYEQHRQAVPGAECDASTCQRWHRYRKGTCCGR
jgi:wobble nucleotide-excising tRNase